MFDSDRIRRNAMKSRHAVLWIFVVIMILAAAYGVIIVRRGFSAKEEPSALETFVARTVRNLSLAASTGNVRNPLPATPENIDEGLEHFADHCAFCHSNDGSGDSETGRNLYPKPPDLRQSETQRLTDGQIYGIIANGVRLTGMPASDHDADDNWRLVLFVRHLPSLTPAEKTEMERVRPSSAHDEEHHHHEGDKPSGAQQQPVLR
jgi:mono/diheme cytochrome c family protein